MKKLKGILIVVITIIILWAGLNAPIIKAETSENKFEYSSVKQYIEIQYLTYNLWK